MRILWISSMIFLMGCKYNYQEKNHVVEKKYDQIEHHQKRGDAKFDYIKLSSFNNDTLKYLKHNFVDQANYHSSHTVSELIEHLEIPVITYSIIHFEHQSMHDKIKGIYLKLESDLNIHRKYDLKITPNILVVYLKDTLSSKDIRQILIKEKVTFGKETRGFFSNKEIRKINFIETSPKTADEK